MDAPPEFALALRQRREELGLTQRELAELLGSRQPRISRWESGERGIGMNTLDRWARALGLRLKVTLEEITLEEAEPGEENGNGQG